MTAAGRNDRIIMGNFTGGTGMRRYGIQIHRVKGDDAGHVDGTK